MLYMQNVCFGSRDTDSSAKELHEEVLHREWYQVQEIHHTKTSQRLGHCSEHVLHACPVFNLPEAPASSHCWRQDAELDP